MAQTPSGINEERHRNLLINLEISIADITNCSRFRVTVRNRDDLTAHFPFNKLKSVEACMKVRRLTTVLRAPRRSGLAEAMRMLLAATPVDLKRPRAAPVRHLRPHGHDS